MSIDLPAGQPSRAVSTVASLSRPVGLSSEWDASCVEEAWARQAERPPTSAPPGCKPEVRVCQAAGLSDGMAEGLKPVEKATRFCVAVAALVELCSPAESGH